MSSLAAEGLRLGLTHASHDFKILKLDDKVSLQKKLGKLSCALWFGLSAGMYLGKANPKISLFCAGVTAVGLCILHKFHKLQNEIRPDSQRIISSLQDQSKRLALATFTKLKRHLESVTESSSHKQAIIDLFEKVLGKNVHSFYPFNEAEHTHYVINLIEPIKTALSSPAILLHVPKIIHIRLGKDGLLNFPDAQAAPYIEKVHYACFTSHFTVCQMQKEGNGFTVSTLQKISLLSRITKGTPYTTCFSI